MGWITLFLISSVPWPKWLIWSLSASQVYTELGWGSNGCLKWRSVTDTNVTRFGLFLPPAYRRFHRRNQSQDGIDVSVCFSFSWLRFWAPHTRRCFNGVHFKWRFYPKRLTIIHSHNWCKAPTRSDWGLSCSGRDRTDNPLTALTSWSNVAPPPRLHPFLHWLRRRECYPPSSAQFGQSEPNWRNGVNIVRAGKKGFIGATFCG